MTGGSSPLPGRVLIVGANYWPEESGSAPYTTGLAEDLAAHGVEVTALCGMPHYPQWRIRDGYRGRIRVREWRNGVEITHSWLWVPSHQSVAQRAVWESTFLVSALTVRDLRRPDVVVASTPSLSGAVAARLLARRWRVPYGLIVQDLVGPGAVQSGIVGGGRVAASVRWIEKWALAKAERVAIVSSGFEPYLLAQDVAADRIEHVRNWSHVPRSDADPSEVRRRFGLPQDRPVVLHAGAMGLKQGLDQVVDAARLDDAGGGSLFFVFAGDGGQVASLKRRADGLGNVAFLPQQPADDYADLLAAADILLISERPEMVNMSLPAKLTSYAAAGRPIAAAVPIGGATAAEIERCQAGIVTPAGEPQELVDSIRRLIGAPEECAKLAANATIYAGETLDELSCLERLRGFVTAVSRTT